MLSGPLSNGVSTGQRICTFIWLELRRSVRVQLYPEQRTGRLQTWFEVVVEGSAHPDAAKA